MRIGLLGFGVVGRGVYDITKGRDDIQVVKVVCLEDVSLPDVTVTKDFQEVLPSGSVLSCRRCRLQLHSWYSFCTMS